MLQTRIYPNIHIICYKTRIYSNLQGNFAKEKLVRGLIRMKNLHEASCHQSIYRNVGGACRRPNVVSLSEFDSRQLTFKKRLLGVVGPAPTPPFFHRAPAQTRYPFFYPPLTSSSRKRWLRDVSRIFPPLLCRFSRETNRGASSLGFPAEGRLQNPSFSLRRTPRSTEAPPRCSPQEDRVSCREGEGKRNL